MEIQTTNTSQLNWTGDALAIGLFEEKTEMVGELAHL
jgi:leucyl aminopeptidase